MSNKTIVKFKNLTKKYHDLVAVNNLNLEIIEGDILGFLGPNGAGKTTTMKILGGLVKPNSGHIEINGRDSIISAKETPNELYQRFGFLLDIPAFYGNATPNKLLRYYCRLLGVPRDQIEKQIDWALEIVELSKWKNKAIKEFSKGMTQRLGLAQAVIHNPDILVLDEPQTGLDPGGRLKVRQIIRKLNKMGKTIFLSSHLLYEISEICDRIAIINHGELIAVDKLVNLEQKMTKKEITVELLEPLDADQVKVIIDKISKKIRTFEENNSEEIIFYNKDLPGLNIYYDGKPTSRKEIHDFLSVDLRLPIIGYSKVRTSRLEDLYLDLIDESEANIISNIKKGGKMKNGA